MYKIYILESPSNKFYVGQTKQDINLRFKQHINSWELWVKRNRPRKSYETKLCYAFDKHHPSEWKIKEIQQAYIKDDINYLEKCYINLYNSIENGYNIQEGGYGWTSDIFSEKHKEKISNGRKEWFKTEEGLKYKEQLSISSKTKNWNRNTIAWNKGLNMKEKYPESYKNNGLYAKTDEFKEFMKEETKKRWKNGIYENRPPLSPEVRERIRLSNIGKKQPNSQKEKVANALAENFIITDKDGNEFEIFNLNKWCRENNINQANMSHVLSGRSKTCKGYKIRRP